MSTDNNAAAVKKALVTAGIFLLLVLAPLSGRRAFAKTAPKKTAAKKTAAKASPGKVHSLYWKASMRKSVKVKGVKIKRGTGVVVVYRRARYSSKSTVRYKNITFEAPNSWLSIKKDLATGSSGDYSTAQKEAYINRKKRASSKTAWLVWISLDKQRVNVFKGKKGRWKLQKTFKCSTGAKQTPTPTGWMRVDFKRMYVEGLKYYTEVCGSGMHRWPGGGKSAYLGKHTASHGCIRMSEDSAKWVYKHVPVRSTVYCY